MVYGIDMLSHAVQSDYWVIGDNLGYAPGPLLLVCDQLVHL